jgi:adenylate cyclase
VADLFVSYARADRARVAPLVAALEAEGWSVWWDPEISPGQEFDRLISQELEKARAVIVVWTPTSVESRWVRGEAREGLDRGVLAPVRFEGAHLPIDMRVIHATDLDGWNEDRQSHAFRDLNRALRRLTTERTEAEEGRTPGAPAIGSPARSVRRRPWPLAAGGAGVAVLAATGLIVWRLVPTAPSVASIGIERANAPAGDGPAQLFADRLPGDMATMAAARPTGLKILQVATGGPETGLVIGSEARTVGDTVSATVNVSSTRDHSILWSASFSRPAAQAAALSEQVASRVADVLTCASPRNEPTYGDLEVVKLFMSACAVLNSPDGTPETARDQLRKVLARAPNFARAWALLAMVSTLLPRDENSSASIAAYRRAVDDAASHALKLDPRQALAWSARAVSRFGVADWPQRRNFLQKALALDPDEAFALNDLNNIMVDIGRLRDSLAASARAADGDPLSPEAFASQAFNTALAGDLAGARTQFATAERRWPGDPAVETYRTYAEARLGDAAAALKRLDDTAHPFPGQPDDVQALRLLCQARLDPAKATQAAAFFRAHADRAHLSQVIQGLAAVGHVDEAFNVAEANVAAGRAQIDLAQVFYRPYMAKFLASPRFMPLAARIGLVDIWIKTGLWPDYCSGPGAPYDCKAEAAKAMAALRQKT